MKLHLPIALLTAVICAASAYGAGYNYTVSDDGSISGTYTGTSLSNSGINAVEDARKSEAKDVSVTIGSTDGTQTTIRGINLVGGRNTYASGNKTLTIQGENTSVIVVAGSNNYYDKNSTSIVPQVGKDDNGNYPSITINVKDGAKVTQIQGGHTGASPLFDDYFSYRDEANSPYNKPLTDAPWALNEKVVINIDNATVGVNPDGSPAGVNSIFGVGYGGLSSNNSVEINISGEDSVVHGGIYAGAQGIKHGQEGENYVHAYTGSTSVKVTDSVVDGTIYAPGRGNNGGTATVNGDTYVELGGTAIVKKNVYAGGAQATYVTGNAKAVISGDDVTVDGTIYGGSSESVAGDRILGFHGTNNDTIAKFLNQSQGFNAVEFKGTTESVDYDTVAASTANTFDTLIISGAENETAMLAAEASKTVVTSDKDQDYKNITINEGGQYDITGGTHKVTGGTDEVILVNGELNVSSGAKLELHGEYAQLGLAYGKGASGKLTVENATVDLSNAQTLHTGYFNLGEGTAEISLKDSIFKGGSQNNWLGGGTFTADKSVVDMCIGTGTSNNFRVMMGLAGNESNLVLENGSTFTSGASRFVTNGQSNTTVNIVVDNSTFTQLAQARIKADGTMEDSITYICDRGLYADGKRDGDPKTNPNGTVDKVYTTITAKNGGKIDIQSNQTFIGSVYDIADGKTTKKATFNVGAGSSLSFKDVEVYANTEVNNNGGTFKAGNMNINNGGQLTFNVNTASAVMTAEKLTVYTGGTLSFVQPAAAEGTSLAMEAPATTTVTLDSALMLHAGSSLVLNGYVLDLGDNALTVYAGAEIWTIDSDAPATLAMAEGVLSGFITTTGNVTFYDAEGKEVESLEATVNGQTGTLGYTNGAVTFTSAGGGNVPEPTTATLSLLALAGLCARRRRK